MLTCSKLIPQGQGLAAVLLKRAATVELDWDVRQKSRFDATDSQGRHLGVFLPRGTVARGGDVLVAEDGSLVRVQAAPQAVLRITHCSAHGTPFDLIRAAYHLGNRHVPIELKADHLKIEPDHVLADMLRRMHLIVTEVNDGFEPESGAYGDGHSHAGGHHHGHGHDHGHEESHGHKHGHEHGHDHHEGCCGHGDHAQAHEHEHQHGHAGCCGHGDHAHDHKHDHTHEHAHDHTPKAQPVTRGKPVGVSIKAAAATSAVTTSAAASTQAAAPAHDHDHDHDHLHSHEHAHGGGCGCGHKH